MYSLGTWHYHNTYTPPEAFNEEGMIVLMDKVRCTNNPPPDWDKVREHDLVFITGDGSTMPKEVRQFEAWQVPHDLYCVNRSMLFFERQIDHWAAIDVEESVWFTQYITGKICPRKWILRHTIGEGRAMFDVWWEREYPFENDIQRRVWIGNSGYFALLTAQQMGYKKIILAGMPLDGYHHWYESKGVDGPHWNPKCYEQWEKYRASMNGDCNIRSMGGRTAEIFGITTKDWADAS